MSITEARRVIRDKNADAGKAYIAAISIGMDERSNFHDLLRCLKRRGPGAAFAAYILHRRTRRRKKSSVWVKDADDWHSYLKSKGFLTR